MQSAICKYFLLCLQYFQKDAVIGKRPIQLLFYRLSSPTAVVVSPCQWYCHFCFHKRPTHVVCIYRATAPKADKNSDSATGTSTMFLLPDNMACASRRTERNSDGS